MNITDYLQRINYTGNTFPTLQLLCDLQKHHLYHVPFENFNIHDDVPIVLDIDGLFNKIVIQKRGGFCYELNNLFFTLLKQLGFDAKLISACVYSDGAYGQPFDHMAIIVSLDRKMYLSDVGFGEFALAPLEIENHKLQHDNRGDFFIQKQSNDYIVFKHTTESDIPEYRFDLLEREVDDFKEMCDYHQTSTKSHFTKKRLISLATDAGRVTISGNQLTVRQNGRSTETQLSENDVITAMQRYFYPFPLTRQ